MNAKITDIMIGTAIDVDRYGPWHVAWKENGEWKTSRKFEEETKARAFAQKLKEIRDRNH